MNKKRIKLWLDEMKIENYTINDNLTVDVNDDVYIGLKRLGEIPVQFNKVSGSFYCFDNQLTTLKGAPKVVGRNFWCDNNQLTTLKGAPKSVGGSFYCFYNPLDSLKGKPNYVKGRFLIDLVTYNRIFRKDKEWSLDDIDEIPAGNLNIKDEIYG